MLSESFSSSSRDGTCEQTQLPHCVYLMHMCKECIKSEGTFTSEWCYSCEYSVWFTGFMCGQMINRNTCIASHVPYIIFWLALFLRKVTLIKYFKLYVSLGPGKDNNRKTWYPKYPSYVYIGLGCIDGWLKLCFVHSATDQKTPASFSK
jgi:hypothetical protein